MDRAWVLVDVHDPLLGHDYVRHRVCCSGSFMEIGEDRSEKTPFDILKERHAKGESTREEFKWLKDDLMKS
jgi:uncharacterized membrane protein